MIPSLHSRDEIMTKSCEGTVPFAPFKGPLSLIGRERLDVCLTSSERVQAQ
jgi:hypothetical protein